MRKRVLQRTYHLVIILTLIVSFLPSLMSEQLSSIRTTDTAEAASVANSTENTSSSLLETESGGEATDPTAPGRPSRGPANIDCMVGLDGVMFLNDGPGSYPTQYFPILNGQINDTDGIAPDWSTQEIGDIVGVPSIVTFDRQLVAYFSLSNTSLINPSCNPAGHNVVLRQIRVRDRDSTIGGIWNLDGSGNLTNIFWSSGTPGVMNIGDTAWGFVFFDADQTTSGLVRFILDLTYESCTNEPSPGACPGVVHQPSATPTNAQGMNIQVRGPRAAFSFVGVDGLPMVPSLANPDELVPYVLRVAPPQLGSTTDIVRVAGTAATLPYCSDTTFLDLDPFGWYTGPDPVASTLVDNTALAPPITTGGVSYYCYFQVEMDTALVDPLTGEFILEADIEITDTFGYTATYHVEAPPVTVRIPEVTVTKAITSPANPGLGVSIGDTIAYEITIRNTGEIPLQQISAIDSLTGPLVIPPGTTLSEDPDGDGPLQGEEIVLTTSYVVRINDPSTLVNTVTVVARLALSGVNQTVTDTAAASIRVISEDLQVTLRLDTVDGAPYNAVTNPPQPGSVLVFTTLYDNRGTINLHDLQYVANYPTFVDAPAPTYVNSVIGSGAILPGLYGDAPSESASTFTYTVPNAFPPDPIFQRVRVRAFRPNNTAVFAEALLVVDLTNPNVSITAIRYRPGIPLEPGEAALRGDTLYFSGTFTNESPLDLCGIAIRQYVRNPITGSLTPGNPFELPANNITWPAGQPAGSLAPSGDPQGRDQATFSGVTYLVNASTPDPLDIVFEVYAPLQGSPTCVPLTDPLVDRTTVSVDISDIQISSFIRARREPLTENALVSYGLYPPPEFTYRFTYVATNVGGVQFTILPPLVYCVTGFPMSCNAAFPTDAINFMDQGDTFTPFQTRTDYFDLTFLAADAANYGNPLQVQVILYGRDAEGQNVVIRTLLEFPIISSELPGTLTGPLNDRSEPADMAEELVTSLVRGDADVPFVFSFTNETSTVLENVYIVNLLETSATPQAGYHQVGAFGFDSYYELCEVQSLSGGGPVNAAGPNTMQPDETIFGTCRFTYSPTMPAGGFPMEVLAVANRVIDPAQRLISVVTWGIREVPHLRVVKLGPGSAVATEPIQYSVQIFNQSMYQYVDFNPANAFTDVIQPDLDPTTLQPAGFNIDDFVIGPALATTAQDPTVPLGYYRLTVPPLANTPATGTYQRNPPGGEFPDASYRNDVTITGTAQSGLIVTGTATASVLITCPLTMRGRYDPILGDPFADTDGRYTLGERARFTFQIANISNVPVTLISAIDEFYIRENQLGANAPVQPASFTWADPGQPNVIPVDGVATYQYDVILRPEDYPDGVDPQRITFTTQVTIANPPPNCDVFDILWYFDSDNPVSIDKNVAPSLVFPGNAATYDIQIENVSEYSDMQVTQVVDNLLSSSPLVMDYSSNLPDVGQSGQLNEYGPNPAADDNSAVLALNGQQTYIVQPDDPPTLTNQATVYYYPLNGPDSAAPGTVNVGPPGTFYVPIATGPGALLSNSDEVSIGTASPLSCIMLPSQTDVPAGGVVDILVTLINGSTDYDITDIQFTVADEIGGLILTHSSPGVPDPLDLTPANRQFSINVSYIVPAGWSNPTLTITCTARGVFELTGELLPDSTSRIRLNVDVPELYIEMVVFSDSNCPLVDLGDADTIADDPDPLALLPDLVPPGTPDGVPEATISQTIYYGILLQNTSLGLEFRNLAIDQATLNNGLSLTADISAQLNTRLPTHLLAPGEQVALCIPYQVVDQSSDPLIHTVQVAAESFSPAQPSAPGIPFTLQTVATVDVQDSNIRIFKTATPTVSFPGDTVEYTLYIENVNAGINLDATLLLDDVWDSLLGGHLDGASYCGNIVDPPAPPPNPTNIPPANFGVCNPALTSIRFDDVVSGIDPYGWDWPDPSRPGVLFEGEIATYRYLYTVQQIDPNPLINTAGVRAVLYDANGNLATPSNWDVQLDTSNEPIQPTDTTLASVAITDSQLLVIKNGPGSAPAGSEVTYTVTVINIGDVDVANVRVWDDRYNAALGLPLDTFMPMTECSYVDPNQSVTLVASVGTLVCQYSLTMPTAEQIENDPTLDPFVNTAYATGEISNGSTLVDLPTDGSDTAIVDILIPDVALYKIPSVGSAAIGDTVSYDIEVENTGDGALRIDQLVDVPASGPSAFSVTNVFIGSADPQGRCDATGAPATVPVVLQQGEVACATVQLVVPNPAPASEYVNTVRLFATTDPGGPNEGPLVDSTSASVDVRNLGIVVEKQAYDCDPLDQLACPNPNIITSINEGVTYYYGITVTNTGDAPLDMIEWRDPLYQNNDWQQLTNAFDTDDAIDPTDSPALDVNETFLIASYPYEAIYARDGAVLTNRVDVRGREQTTGNFTTIRGDTTQVFVLPVALQITKRACIDTGTQPANFNPCPVNTPTAVRPGGTIWYEVTLLNPSATVTVINVEVTDTLQGPWAAAPTTLGPGQEVTWIYQGAPVSGALTNVVNTVTVTAESNTYPISRSDTVSVPVALGDLLVLITEDSGVTTAEVGDLLNFTVLVQNLSTTDTIYNISVAVPFYDPNPLNAVPFDLLPGGVSAPFTFQYTVTPADNTMVFSAIAQGALQGNFVTAQNSWTVTRSADGLSVTKTADTNYAAVNDTVNYTITVTNESGNAITGLTVTDPLLEGLPEWAAAGWGPTLAAGETETHTFPYLVQAPIPSNPILNTVTVTGTVNGVVTTVQAGPVAVFIPDGNLLVTNTPSTNDALVGDFVSFTYRICNLADGTPPNDQPITTISLVDDIGPLPLPGFGFSLDPGDCYETARTGVEMLATDVPVYTMAVTASGAQFQGGNEVPLSQTVSRDVNVRQPGQNLVFNVAAIPNPVIYTGTPVPVQLNFTLQNIGTGTLTIQEILDNSPVALCTAYSPVPTAPANATLSPGEILAFTCNYNYLGTVDPIDGIWTANMTTGDTATTTISIPVVADPNVDLIISQVDANPTIGVPGGQITYTYHVRNVSGVTVTDVRLEHNPTNDSPECEVWTAIDAGSNPLWVGTASLAVAAEITAQATCDILGTAAAGSTATHVIEVYQGAAVTPEDTATVNTLIQPPITVTAPTSAFTSNPATPITTWRVGTGYAVDISFDITNASNSLQITGITPQLTVDGTAICAGGFTFNPQTFAGTLNPNATVTVTCLNYPPTIALAPVATVVATATGFVQAVNVSDTASTDFPIYDLGYTVTLDVDPTAGDVGNTVNFTLTIVNTGTSPLFLPPSAQDPITTGRLDNPAAPDVLGDLYAALNSVCFSSGSLAAGATCTLAYDNAVLTNNELTYTIDQADPATITFMVGLVLWSNQPTPPAAPAFEIANQDTVQVTVSRPAINAFGLLANPNPGVIGGQITFTASIQNSGTQVLNNLSATLQLTQLSFTNAVGNNDGIVLTSGRNQTPLPTITMVINDADGVLNPGEVATATGYWLADRVGSFRATLTATGRAGTTQTTATDIELLEFRANSSTGVGTPTATIPGTGLTPTATIATTDPDGNPLDPTALDPTITKTVTPESALPGQDVTFTVTITNGSTTAMANITVTDNMPLELTVNNATTSVGASVVSGQLITVTTGQLNPGERITVVIIARVNDDVAIPSLITNDACAAATGRTQICATVELPIGADAEALPTTGQGEPDSADLNMATQGVAGVASRPFGVAPLLMLGLLALLSTGQINRQRWLLGGLAVLIIAIIASALVLVGSGDEQDDPTGTAQVVLPPGVTATASPTLDRAPTLTPLPTGEPLESPVAPTPLNAPPTLRPSATPYIPPTPSGDRRIDIPKLNFTDPIPIVELAYADAAWDVSNLGHSVGWLEKTTWMAPTWGNTVLVAHVQLSNDDPGPFKRLDELEVGDDIFVYDGPYKYAFRVTEVVTVNATAIEVTHPTVDPILTLLTCTNWDFARGVYSDRLVIRAEPILDVN